jgi:2-oxoglutarate/2-oxoacid ferredoxin oxidoreductase subunit alpha
MRTLLIAELNADTARLVPILHFDGTPITARFIAAAITRHVHAEIVEPKAKKKAEEHQ